MMHRGLRRSLRPLFVSTLLATAVACAASTADAQDPLRPWLDWRTISTQNYRFHFPRELEAWTRAVAERVESIDSAITALVGSTPPRPVHIVIDDPFSVANGYALPFIDRPVSVWWATPADPRSVIGNYRSWGEILAVHELTHITHMTRPSRNRLQRALWSSLSANVGPIMRKAPRWAYEGYATVIEGVITGSGRPNNVWRPAILRQWAIEGRLPTYDQLTVWDDFSGGGFAYLSGSAFLEWLTRREGDSSLVHVWRRLTARRVRTFDASFQGVFGDSPRLLYGRHAAELTRDAMLARAELERAGLVEGELVQRLAWGTGDPALSPDGERVAVSVRERDRPMRLVIWKTAAEPEDTAAVRRRIDELKKDPQDVPARRFYPPPKRPLKTLPAVNGRSYHNPRWFADNRRILLTRWAMRGDGTLAPDLYTWDTETGDVRRTTYVGGVLHGDPHPSMREAVAVRCRRGHCDVVSVDLTRGTVHALLEGDAERSYYRPRFSPSGDRFAVSVSDGGRWRIVVADRDGGNVRFVDPGDGANRYDAQWLRSRGADTLVVVSERGGIANLELLSVATAARRALTRVTGAALAPDVHARDGSIWFLALHSLGFDVRRLPPGNAADSTVAVTAERFGFAGLRSAPGIPLRARTVGATKPYGSGPRYQRWFPGMQSSGDGTAGSISILTGDIVGRLNATVTGAYGEPGTSQGGSLRAAWRFPRPTIDLGIHGVMHEPSMARAALAGSDSLDAASLQGVLSTSARREGDSWSFGGRVGGAGGRLEPRLESASHSRSLGFAEVELRMQQSRGSRGVVERLHVHGSQGATRGDYRRAVGSFSLATTGRDIPPLALGVTAGRITGTVHPFEMFAVGGGASPIADTALLRQRYSMPMFPTAVAVGSSLLAWRAAIPSLGYTMFYEGASTSMEWRRFTKWNRAVGLETSGGLPPVPMAYLPAVQFRAGAAYTLDPPFENRVRVYMEMRMDP